ncbi:MAG: MFS transporter [Cephaloticoccus sp.]|nr:MFS transporter [Cephaloticoccus sp.]MCF7758972.1 MFS transporter [Cephaloticoccus sp.]
MSLPDATILPPQRERLLLLTLGAIQFIHIMDFMIMMPLGSSLMRVFGISPGQFSLLVAAYGLSAAISGFVGGFFLDRFDRRSALLVLFTGFGLATLACALSPNYHTLLIARFAAGAFGGVAGSVVTAMVGDAIPAERRGRAMGMVMAAYPLASILGIPLGLFLAGWLGWHAPFFLLSLLCVSILTIAFKTLPHVTSHRSLAHPVRQMIELMTHRVHLRGFLLTASLIFSGAIVVPFMAPSMVANVGLDERHQLPLVYMLGGACTFFTMPWFGRLADRYDKVQVLIAISLVAVPAMLMTTRLGPGPLYTTFLTTTLFFIGMSGRFAPTMALITNAVAARYRGGFMSVNSAVQQAAGALANIVAGLIIVQGPNGRLLNYAKVGWLSFAAFGCTIALAFWLRKAAPHAARNAIPMPPAEPAT